MTATDRDSVETLLERLEENLRQKEALYGTGDTPENADRLWNLKAVSHDLMQEALILLLRMELQR